jgi:hypothetical protein
MIRRQILTKCAVVLSVGLVGCSGGDGSGSADETATETATPTPTPTPTSTPTPTPTATATSTPSAPTHETGEQFTVGSGDTALRFTVRELFRATELGPARSNQATGRFCVVILSVFNPTSSSQDVPIDRITLRADDIVRRVDTGDSQAVGSDDRIDVSSIANQTVGPTSSVTGAIVYDAPPDNEYQLEFAPVGSAQNHIVPVGPISELDPLPSGY